VATDRLINLYLEESSNQKGVYTLYSMPGLRQVALLPSGPVRGLYEATNGRVFAVTSTSLYEVFAGWSFLSRGTIPTGTTPASMTDDGAFLILSVNGAGFALEFVSNTFTTLPLTGPLTFGQVVYLDGYILTQEPGTRRVWYAEPLNPVVWPGANVLQAEGRADNTVTLLSDHSQLWIFGTQTIEPWDTTGNSLAPFARNASAFVEQGCETPWSAVALDETIYFLGGTPRGEGPVWGMKGYTPERVSTHAMESAMSAMETVGDCIAQAARHGGHAWLVLDFPTGGETWAYDTATHAWMELAALADDGTLLPYPCNMHCSAFAEHLWGSRETGALYIWDIDYHKYGDGPRLCRRTAPHVRADQKRIRHREFRLEAEAGVGLDGGVVPGSTPQAMLRYSDDGGHVWSQGRWRSLGKIGATTQQAVWLQLGQSRSRAYEVSVTDPVKVVFLAAYLEVG
jgi:hypothetical protein